MRDRVAQTAVMLILAPIFEADLPPEQYAYRPGRNALDAVRAVHGLLTSGHTEVVDADLSGYFDTIPHAELMTSVARRVSDKHLLHLIKMWLVAPVEERDNRGRIRRTTQSKDQRRGIPQGSPISPLLANLYMRRFILGWKRRGHEQQLDAHIVNYADDYVICCRGTASAARRAMATLIARLKLTINQRKTQCCLVPDESFNFLGYTIGRCYSPRTGKVYIGTRPSTQVIRRLCADYFCLGPVSKAYTVVDRHARYRLRQWLCGKHQRSGQGWTRYSDEYIDHTLGLARLQVRTRNLPWANA